MSDEICGEPTADGSPCENPACRTDGKCWMHTEADESANVGRPSKLSYERQERIAAAVEEGVPLVAACRLNGISHETHSNWMEKGAEQEEGPHAEYFGRLTRALGEDQKQKTQQMWEAAQKTNDTATMLTVLKQRYQETWQDSDIGEAKPGTRQKIPEQVVSEWYERNG